MSNQHIKGISINKIWKSCPSTSINLVCGDTKFSTLKGFLWVIQCIISLCVGKKHDNLKFKKWIPQEISQKEFDKFENISPARLTSELFLKHSRIINPNENYRILEIGPGTNPLSRYNNILFKSYTGIGFVIPESSQAHENYYIQDINFIDLDLFNFNLFYSHSVLEHLSDDIKLFEKLHKSKTFLNLQIHFFPSSICLLNYFWHGYRVYNLRNISKLVKSYLDDANYQVQLIGLGGYRANLFYAKQLANRITTKVFKRAIFQKNVYSYKDFINDIPSNFAFSTYLVLIIRHKSDFIL
jgi:hypothetical protein